MAHLIFNEDNDLIDVIQFKDDEELKGYIKNNPTHTTFEVDPPEEEDEDSIYDDDEDEDYNLDISEEF